ncbi:MAG: LysE family translocator [Bacteroidota bacterium]
MNIELIISFAVTSIVLALMPGPDNVFVLTESITKGRRDGIALSAGLSSGVIIHTALIATGLSVLIQQSEVLFLVIKIAGACYLLFLVYQTYQSKETGMHNQTGESSNPGNPEKASFFTLFKKGFIMNVLNPKVTLFFIAFLPQFVSENGSISFELQILLLGFIFMLTGFLVFSSIAVLADRLSRFLTSQIFWRNVKWVKMIVLTCLALFLFI